MQLVIAIAFWLLLWAVFASPFLLGFYLVVRLMRRRGVRSGGAMVVIAVAFSLLVAPVPTPIITVLVPHAFVLVDTTYYARILHGPATLSRLWPWVAVSLVLTFVLVLALSLQYVRRPGTHRV